MTKYGKLNLLGILAVPVVAVLSSLIVFPGRMDAAGAIFGLNLFVLLIAGLFSWLMLRKANNDASSWLAISPTLVPAAFTIGWYLWRLISPAQVGPGAEYIAAPQYHVMAVIAMALVAFILGFFVRSR